MKNYEILKTLPPENIEPRQFLRYCFDINKLSPEAILEEETSFNYCSRSVRLLSKILGMKRKTVREWGENPNFERMPHYARKSCTYAQIALSIEKLRIIAHQEYEAPTVSVMEFIEEILLHGLLPSERLKVISSTKFRGQCFTLLSETLGVSKRTIYEWGRDIELPSMPHYHQHTLGYALIAYRRRQQTSAKQSAA
ncbi:MAG: hypothetical protein HC815_06030 [Richelia sp. RM1_1_1]|nr:hypothetical protein [Richelia sp. RM1_1_1]